MSTPRYRSHLVPVTLLAFGMLAAPNIAAAASHWAVVRWESDRIAVSDRSPSARVAVSAENDDLVLQFRRSVRWYQLGIAHPWDGADCGPPGESAFTTPDRSRILVDLRQFPGCIWEAHLQWID